MGFLNSDEPPARHQPTAFDGFIIRTIDRFPLVSVTALFALVMLLLDWAGILGGGRRYINLQSLSQMWWHFFVFWAVLWVACVVFKWIGERLPWS